MAAVYRDHQIYEWLDGNGRQLLLEGRHTWPRLDLDRRFIVTTGTTVTVLPWVGDRTLYTAALALQLRGLETSKEGPALVITDAGSDDLRKAVDDLLAAGRPDPVVLAATITDHQLDKWDWVLDDTLACEADAARRLDVPAAWTLLARIRSELRNPPPLTDPAAARGCAPPASVRPNNHAPRRSGRGRG